MKTFLMLLALLTVSISISQEKFEKEYRIQFFDAPKSSQETITKWNFPKKVKWFAEESNDGKTYEAKTCFEKHQYSIEFSESGEILDVEKTVKFKELESELKIFMIKQLQTKFKKSKIKKTQIQLKGEENQLYKAIFDLNLMKNSIQINYEIIVKAKKENEYDLYEILFDEKGNIIKELKFKPSNSLNLEF